MGAVADIGASIICTGLLAPALALAGTSTERPVSNTEPAESPSDVNRFPITAPLFLNERDLGEIDVLVPVSGDGEIAVDAKRIAALLSPHLRDEYAKTITSLAEATGFVDLVDLPALNDNVRFDMSRLAVVVSIDAAARRKQALSLAPPLRSQFTENGYTPADFAVGVNARSNISYLVASGDAADEGLSEPAGSFTGFANFFGGRGFTVFGGVDYDGNSSQTWRRRDLFAVRDFQNAALRLEVGEIVTPFASLQSSGRVRGFSLSRRYDAIQPFRNLAPTGRREFLLEQPATVDFVLNGAVVERRELAAGRYQVSDFPFLDGRNEVQIIAEDSQGLTEILNASFSFNQNLLDPGVVDFGVGAGQTTGLGDDNMAVASGYARFGVFTAATLGANAQLNERGDYVLGGEGQFATPLGLVFLDAAYTSFEDNAGYSVLAQLRQEYTLFKEEDTRLDLFFETQSPRFSGVFSTASATNPFAWRSRADITYFGLKNWNLRGELFYTEGRGNESNEYGGALSVGAFVHGVNANLSAQYRGDSAADDDVVVLFSLTRALGRGWRANASHTTASNRTNFTINRIAPDQIGALSLNGRYENSDTVQSARAQARYVDNRLIGQLENSWRSDKDRDAQFNETTLRLETFIGFADNAFAVGRPNGSGESFVIAKRNASLDGVSVDVKDLSGRRTEARIDAFGPGLIGLDRPYLPQSLSFEAEDLPFGYSVPEAAFSVNPPLGAGYVFEYGSDNWRTVVGTFLIPTGAPFTNAIGAVCVKGETKSFFTNSVGRFVLDGASLGRYEVLVRDRTVGVLIIESKDNEALIDVGEQTLSINERGLPTDDAPDFRCEGD